MTTAAELVARCGYAPDAAARLAGWIGRPVRVRFGGRGRARHGVIVRVRDRTERTVGALEFEFADGNPV